MFNVAVVNLKDIIKYLVSITMIILIVTVLARFFSNANKSDGIKLGINSKVENIKSSSYLICLDETMPNTERTNQNADKIKDNSKEKSSMVQSLLGIELRMAKNKTRDKVLVNEETIMNEEDIDEIKDSQDTDISLAENGLGTEVVTPNPIALKYNSEYNKVKIKNETSFELTEDILRPNIDINNRNVVIFHTHTCESYTSSELYPYEPTGNFRTTDKNYSVVRVGDELTKYLTQYQFNVNHDSTYHDYPAYTGSYTRSLNTVQNILNTTKSDIVIDLHRDAIGSKSDYAPTVKIGEDYVAQLMFVVRYKWRWAMASKLATKFKVCYKSSRKSRGAVSWIV